MPSIGCGASSYLISYTLPTTQADYSREHLDAIFKVKKRNYIKATEIRSSDLEQFDGFMSNGH